ncbi:MAG TPA: YcbK family protein [Alphaproteobacteria bacterium]|nr:YcbK family protein [Alphaproteobacteria bacterium]
MGAVTCSAFALAPAIVFARPAARTLSFRNLHTGEGFNGAYWANGSYMPDALAEIRTLLRDFRTGDEHDIDCRLLDLLTALHGGLDTVEPFEVISGYRSPKTNAMLREVSNGVAAHSLHMEGMAIDIRVPGRSLPSLRNAALALRQGGVGYYPASDFVHVDVGRVRRW